MKLFSIKPLMFLILLASCTNNELLEIKPVITLKIESGLVYTDTSIIAGQQYNVQIIASSENGENLTNLIIKSNGARVFDNGYNTPAISENITLIKNIDDTETLTFIIRNKARLADSITITINKLISAYAGINRTNAVLAGCSQNINLGNYYSLSAKQIYFQNEAFSNQNLIDIIYYFDPAGDENSLGSPGANLSGILTGPDAPENWTIKRTTHFSREPLTIIANEFENAQNDSLILSHLFTDGGRKAKNLVDNQYFGFVNNENKYGIIRIENVTGQAEGNIQFSIIMQE